MSDDFRKEISSKISDERIAELRLYIAGVEDWDRPSSENLVLLSELQQLLLMKGFAEDKPARFDLLDVADCTGLSTHDFAHYAEIGNWIAMDRRFSEMEESDIDEFYESMDELVSAMAEDEEVEETFVISIESAVQRVDEIAELNKLFYGE
jgi:hypothetical protein